MARRDDLLPRIATLALRVGRQHFAPYSCPKSKRAFTQPQLMACLVLKAHGNLTYRGAVQLLSASAELRDALGLSAVPAHTTLKEFERRALTPALLDAVVGSVLALCREAGTAVAEVAVDSTGLEPTPASVHYTIRAGRSRKQYVKLSLAVVCGAVLLGAMDVGWGPSHDLCQASAVLWRLSGRCKPAFAYFDKGYDAEKVHRFCRDGWGVLSYAPPVVKARDGSVRTPHRSRCARYRPHGAGRRWHVESFISGMKRVCGSALRARLEPALFNEAGLKALAYAVRR